MLKLSRFTKILFTLIFILILESILIYVGYRKAHSTLAINIPNYEPKKPIVIVVDVTSNYLILFQNGKPLKEYQVAGGKPTTPSPIGTWKIISKDTWGEGFGGYWMGFNVPCPTYL